jgi:hypothetical protein
MGELPKHTGGRDRRGFLKALGGLCGLLVVKGVSCVVGKEREASGGIAEGLVVHGLDQNGEGVKYKINPQWETAEYDLVWSKGICYGMDRRPFRVDL